MRGLALPRPRLLLTVGTPERQGADGQPPPRGGLPSVEWERSWKLAVRM